MTSNADSQVSNSAQFAETNIQNQQSPIGPGTQTGSAGPDIVRPNIGPDNVDPGSVRPDNKQELPQSHFTQAALAQLVIDQNRIIHVPEMQTFIVEGSRDEKYAVQLFPKEKCQCPATGTCYHVMAAQKSIGLYRTPNRKVNLKALAKNSKKTADKRSGRKRPRPLDFDYTVSPAPDSKFCKTSIAYSPDLGVTPIDVGFATSTPQVISTPN